MKNEILFIVEDSLDGGFEAHALGFSIFTEANSYSELKDNIRDAVAVHFDEGAQYDISEKLEISKDELNRKLFG